jgi:hypothetical protein
VRNNNRRQDLDLEHQQRLFFHNNSSSRNQLGCLSELSQLLQVSEHSQHPLDYHLVAQLNLRQVYLLELQQRLLLAFLLESQLNLLLERCSALRNNSNNHK